MKTFYKFQSKLIFMVVFTLLLQVVAPVIATDNFSEEPTEDIVEETLEGEGAEEDKEEESLDPNEEGEPETEEPGDPEDPKNSENESEDPKYQEDEDTEEELVEEKDEINLIKLEEANKIETLAEGRDLGNIFTFKSFKIDEKEANENQVVVIGDGTTVNLEYKWDTIGKDAKAGDWAEIIVPDAFIARQPFEDQPIVVEGVDVGKHSLIDNKLKFIFNKNIEDGEVKDGKVGFGFKFNVEKFKEDVVEEIMFNDKDEKSITIIGKPTEEVKSIGKKGKPDSKTDAKTITWIVYVTNPSNKEIENAKIEDLLPVGLEIDLDTLKVNNLKIGLDGTLTPGNSVVKTARKEDNKLEVDLGTIDPYKGYKVEYTTKITDKSKTKFTNDANLLINGKKLPAKATVSGLKVSNLIEKDGSKKGENIEWSIDVNKPGTSIDEAIVGDDFPVGTELVPGSIKIFKIKKGSDDKWTEVESDKTADEFPVNLGKINDAYRIKFETSIDYSEINEGVYQESNNFINKTTLKDGTKEIGDDDKEVTIIRPGILSKIGKADVDYKNKKINWTVTVNQAKHKIDGAIVTDILPAGLTINKYTIEVFKGNEDVTDTVTITTEDYILDSNALNKENVVSATVLLNNVEKHSNENELEKDKKGTKITIDLGIIEEEYTIKYTTEITDLTIDKFNNGVSLGGKGVGKGGTEVIEPVNPPKNTYLKERNGIDYNEKIMNWKLTVNPTREAIKELTITDTFPNKGLILLEEDFVVKLGEIKLKRDEDYTLEPGTENTDGTDVTGYQKGFIVKFIGEKLPLNDTITITYKTSYDPEEGIDKNTSSDKNRKYINKANFHGKTISNKTINEDKEAYYQVKTESWNSGKKTGKLKSKDSKGNLVDGWISGNERKLEWEVYINYLEQDLKGEVTITDELSYDGKVDVEEIKVKNYIVNADGTTKLGETLESSKYKLVEVDNNKGFKLIFESGISKRYAIVFTTSVPDVSLASYENKATLEVDGDKYLYEHSIDFKEAGKNLDKSAFGVSNNEVFTDDEVKWNIKINQALSTIKKDVEIVDTISEGMVYKNDSLKVYKLEGNERVLVDPKSEEGYELEVGENNGEKETVLTIKFKKSISSTYEIDYTTVITATKGEVKNKVEYKGKNLKTVSKESSELRASQSRYIDGKWDPNKGVIVIKKVDSKGDPITAEAEFEVYYYLNGEKRLVSGENFKTDKEGKIEVGNLVIGNTYYIKEVKAPTGFKFDEKFRLLGIEVTKAAGKDNSGAYKFNIKNDNIKSEVKGYKEWTNGPTQRPDVQLQLYRQIENGEKEKVEEPVTLKNGTTSHTWTELNLTDNAGKEYKYTVDEVKVPENYEKTVSEDGLKVTNTYVSPNIEISGEKIWKDIDAKGDRPDSITVNLLRNGEVYKNEEVNPDKNGHWKYQFEGLPEFDDNGIQWGYTIDEEYVEGYSKKTEAYNLINTKIGTTEVTVQKTWMDEKESDRPDSIKVNLLQNGIVFTAQDIKVNAEGNWSHTFSYLPKYDEEGKLYEYTITEHDVPGYESKINEFEITNTRSEEKSININKIWLDDNSKDRPDSIKVELFRSVANGEKEAVKTYTITAKDNWKLETEDLQSFDQDGKAYTYVIEEEKTEGYESTISGFDITNLRVGETQVTGRKIWTGGPSRKPTIELQLYRNGSSLGNPVELEDGKREYTWTGLDKYDDRGVEYKYTVDEVNTPRRYRKSISSDGLTITNRYVPPVYPPTYPDYPDPKDPEDPDAPDPTEPEDPEDPEDPDTPDPTDPEDPEDPDTPDPTDPESPDPGEEDEDDPTIDIDGDTPSGGTDVDDPTIDIDGDTPTGGTDVDKPSLPKTGEVDNIFFYLTGLVLIVLGFVYRRKTA